jgi:hypothetical protein
METGQQTTRLVCCDLKRGRSFFFGPRQCGAGCRYARAVWHKQLCPGVGLVRVCITRFGEPGSAPGGERACWSDAGGVEARSQMNSGAARWRKTAGARVTWRLTGVKLVSNRHSDPLCGDDGKGLERMDLRDVHHGW